MGVFDTIIGYEVFDGGNNPNYTRSYGFTIEPTTHTGLLGSYQLCKAASVSVGIANTHGPAINEKADAGGLHAESYKTYMAAVALTAPEDWGSMGGSTAYAGVVNGLNTAGPAVQTSWYVGMTLNTPVKALKVGASFDYLGTTDRYGADDSYANAWALYTSFQATEKLSLHLRGEYASTDTGIFGDVAAPMPPGENSEIFALTGTLQYDLWKNVLSRLEIRWDHLAGSFLQTGYGGTPAGGGGGGTTGSKRNNVLIAANVIYKF
jgi:hypothetical protein